MHVNRRKKKEMLPSVEEIHKIRKYEEMGYRLMSKEEFVDRYLEYYALKLLYANHKSEEHKIQDMGDRGEG